MVPMVLNQVQSGIMSSQKVDYPKQELHCKDLKQMEVPKRKRLPRVVLNKGKLFRAQQEKPYSWKEENTLVAKTDIMAEI